MQTPRPFFCQPPKPHLPGVTNHHPTTTQLTNQHPATRSEFNNLMGLEETLNKADQMTRRASGDKLNVRVRAPAKQV